MFITSLYAGLLALLFFVLSLRVIGMRRGSRISLGDNGDTEMQRRIRAHGNFAEYVPLALLLMALLEFRGMTSMVVLHALGLALMVGRLLHGIALGYTRQFMLGRVLGTLLTLAVIVVAGALCAWKGLAGALLVATTTTST